MKLFMKKKMEEEWLSGATDMCIYFYSLEMLVRSAKISIGELPNEENQ